MRGQRARPENTGGPGNAAEPRNVQGTTEPVPRAGYFTLPVNAC